jgi:hypothetical protein
VLAGFATGLAALPVAAWIRTSPLAYPALEVAHLWALAVVFGTILIVDLRLIGLRLGGLDRFPLAALARALLPWTIGAFIVAALSGGLMFISRAPDFVANAAFLSKLVLLGLAGLNALALHLRGGIDALRSSVNRWQGALSIALWLGIIASGRWIAYV